MYEELVKSIHCCFGFDSMQADCENCMMKDKREEHNYVGCCDALGLAAADAIEELQKRVPKVPHGRLIDADALYEVVKKRTRNWAGGWNDIECVLTGNDIKNALTVIEAEGNLQSDRANTNNSEVVANTNAEGDD